MNYFCLEDFFRTRSRRSSCFPVREGGANLVANARNGGAVGEDGREAGAPAQVPDAHAVVFAA